MKVSIKINSVKTNTYKVRAKTYDEARDVLANRDASGCYEANPTYSYGYDKSGEVDAITIVSKPAITMPSWSEASKLKGEEKKNWTAMIKALHAHEHEHAAIFERDARAFKAEREKAGGFPKGDIGKVMEAFFADSQKNQDAFDKKTDHGAKKGVALPPVS